MSGDHGPMEVLDARAGAQFFACGMKVRVLAEASTRADYQRRQWGLALAVGDGVLFDTFSDPQVLADGAAAAGYDLATTRDIVISHDHWDHTGGLALARERAPQATVHIPDGAPALAARLQQEQAPLRVTSGLTELRAHLLLLGPLTVAYKGAPLAEQALVIRGGSGYALLLGCAHAGIAAWLDAAAAAGLGTPNLVLGGLHLSGGDETAYAAALDACRRHNVRRLAPCHCTGQAFIDYCRAPAGKVS